MFKEGNMATFEIEDLQCPFACWLISMQPLMSDRPAACCQEQPTQEEQEIEQKRPETTDSSLTNHQPIHT